MLVLLLIVPMVACGGPRAEDVIARAQALQWQEVLELRIVKVYDGFRHSRDPHVSHLVAVEVVGGSSDHVAIGERLVLPYDEWMTKDEPPSTGTVVITTPAAWVRGDNGAPRP